MPDSDDGTLGVVVARLEDLRVDLRDLRGDLVVHRAELVPRTEWTLRNNAVDHRFEGQGREISEIKQRLAAARAPWWSVGAIVLAAGSLAWTILGPAIVR